MQGPYRGIVVNNNDPKKACRVTALIHDLFYDAEEERCIESPWIEAMTGAGDDMGIVFIPPVNSQIFVWVEPDDDDDLWSMTYTLGPASADHTTDSATASIPVVAEGGNDLTTLLKGVMKAEVPSTDSRLRDGDGDKIAELPDITTVALVAPESLNQSEYPYNRCVRTESGILIEMDDTPSATRFHLFHPSGTYLELGDDGQWNERSGSQFSEVGAKYTKVIGGDDVRFVGGSQRTRVTGKRVDLVDGLAMTKARRLAFDSDVQVSLNSRGPILILSDGVGRYDHAMGREVSVGGQSTETYDSRTVNINGKSALSMGNTLDILVPGAIPDTDALGPLLNPLEPFFRVRVNPIYPNAQATRTSATGGVHLELQALPNPIGETFIINSGGAVAFTGGLLSSPTPATTLAKWNIANVPGTGLELILGTLITYLTQLEVKLATVAGSLAAQSAASTAILAMPPVNAAIGTPQGVTAAAAVTAADASAISAAASVLAQAAAWPVLTGAVTAAITAGGTGALRAQ